MSCRQATLTKVDVKFLLIGGAICNDYQLVLEFAGRFVVLISLPEIIRVIINVDNYLHSVTATSTSYCNSRVCCSHDSGKMSLFRKPLFFVLFFLPPPFPLPPEAAALKRARARWLQLMQPSKAEKGRP